MQEFGKLLLIAGAVLLALGTLALLAGRLGIGRLPGDLVVRGRGTTVYLPLATSLLLSLLAILLAWLFFRR